jgi:hypothetical protein
VLNQGLSLIGERAEERRKIRRDKLRAGNYLKISFPILSSIFGMVYLKFTIVKLAQSISVFVVLSL